jgi:general stress protein 26
MSQSLATGDHEAVLAKLTELIDEIQFAMMTTVEADGTLRSRPMATHRNPGKVCDGTLWFFTKGNAPKADEVRDDQHINLSYASPGQNKYVSLSGKAILVHNRAKIEEFWKPEYKAWFPDGIDDPELAILRVIISKAEYWDTPGSNVGHAIGLIKAVATGQQYQPGDHEKVEL